MTWLHDDLLVDLAGHLRASGSVVAWVDMQLGPVGSPRPDVYTIDKTFEQLRARVYEIKVSRSDFLRDITSGKWTTYRAFSSAVIFATPDGLVKRSEIPDEAGWIVRNATGWRSLKRATMRPLDTLPRKVWQKLLIDGIDRANQVRSSKRAMNAYLAELSAAKKFGHEMAALAAEPKRRRRELEAEIAHLETEAARQRERIAKQTSDAHAAILRESTAQMDAMAQAVGMDWRGDNVHAFHRALTAHIARVSESARVQAMAGALRQIARSINEVADDPALNLPQADARF